MAEPLITLITTLVGAFSGVLAAFFLQEYRESRNTEEQNVAAINRAIYTIYNLWSIQHQYQVEVIEPYRGKSDAWLNMSATPPSNHGLTSFDAEALSFLLKTHTQTYSELMLEENRFQAAMNLIRLRSSTALNEAWPRLAAANVALGARNDEKRIRGIIGVDICQKLEKFTEGIIEHIDENDKSLRDIGDKLRAAFMEIYPKRKIIRVDFDAST